MTPDGAPLVWQQREVSYVVVRPLNYERLPGLDESGLGEQVRAAFARWDSGCAALRPSFAGFVDAAEVGDGQDGRNVIRFIDAGWCSSGSTCRGSAHAITRVFADTKTGQIAEADIELDSERETFSKRGTGPSDAIAIEAVLTHEIGHLLGLAHPPPSTAGTTLPVEVMEDGHTRGSDAVVEPSAEEKAFVCDTYSEEALKDRVNPQGVAARPAGCAAADGGVGPMAWLLGVGLARRRRQVARAVLLVLALIGSPELVAAAGPPVTAPIVAAAEREGDGVAPAERRVASMFGGTGGLRAVHAFEVVPGSAALTLRMGLFSASPWLVQAGARQDRNTRVFGTLTYVRSGPDYRLLRELEWSLSIGAQLNENMRNDPGRRDSAQQISIANVATSVRYGKKLTTGLAVGGQLLARLFSTPFSSGFGALAMQLDALVSYDLGSRTKVPLRLHANLGVRGDTSFGALPDNQCTSRTVDACYRSRAVQAFAYDLAASAVRLTLALDAPLPVTIKGNVWAFTPFLEWGAQAAIGPGDLPLSRALTASSVVSSRLVDRMGQTLSAGVRVAPELPLVFELAADIGLQTPSLRYGNSQPPWQALVSVSYMFDREQTLTALPNQGINQSVTQGGQQAPVKDPPREVIAVEAAPPEVGTLSSVEAASAPASTPVEPDIALVAPTSDVSAIAGAPSSPAPIAFRIGQVDLDAEATSALDKLAADLAAHPEIIRVTVMGHTDSQGNAAKNVALSEKRAQAVKEYLIKKGVADGRIVASGAGGVQPLVPNLTAANRAKNNRVEIELGRAP